MCWFLYNMYVLIAVQVLFEMQVQHKYVNFPINILYRSWLIIKYVFEMLYIMLYAEDLDETNAKTTNKTNSYCFYQNH